LIKYRADNYINVNREKMLLYVNIANFNQYEMIIGISVRFGSGPDDNLSTRPDPGWQPRPDILGSGLSIGSGSRWVQTGSAGIAYISKT
jgi:hypothetical protein